MSAQERALTDLARLLDRLEVPYMIIGGMANAVWGEPRATVDIDATVWIAEDEIEARVPQITAAFEALVPEPVRFIVDTRVLPLSSHEGVRVDLIFGLLPFEEEAIRRAVVVPVAGVPVRFCTAEDLILHKITSERDRDLSDARGIVLRRLHELDLDYLEPRVAELSRHLERPEIRERWEAWKRVGRRRTSSE
ncbi:MAG: hypothetical protein A2V74_03920 [Acidobacteria bacterium RBG_16_70_10]|nr:MAG: hypothetical protein A2V74_03920 [Acidobacteria bacterium RBG_16_70_10]